MDVKKIIEKVGLDEFRTALKSDEPGALENLLEGEGITLSDDQLEYIAGGYWDMFTEYDKPLNRDAAFGPQQLGALAAPVLRTWGVARAWVYGSFALGWANEDSDVDMIVQMPEGMKLGYRFFDLRRQLGQALGRTVDLHLPPNESADQEYMRVIERQKVLVYDADKDARQDRTR